MMSLRALARSAPRTLSRFATSAPIRRPATQSLLRSPLASLRPRLATSAFSTSVFRRAEAGNEVDEQLSAKLDSEIQFETEVKDNEPSPASIQDFLDNGPFELVDTPGKEEVVLKRKYNDESITVTFSISDLANYDPDMYEEDPALADEDVDGPEGQTPDGRSAEDLAADADEELDGDRDGDAAVPCQLNIVIEKPGKGALNVMATAQDGGIVVENLYYYADAALAHGATAETAHKGEDVYPGPSFGTLDEDLQVLMERYLEERGITQALAVFVPDYLDVKEQREYLAWLNNVKNFVDA